jgi:hypothetical protein
MKHITKGQQVGHFLKIAKIILQLGAFRGEENKATVEG